MCSSSIPLPNLPENCKKHLQYNASCPIIYRKESMELRYEILTRLPFTLGGCNFWNNRIKWHRQNGSADLFDGTAGDDLHDHQLAVQYRRQYLRGQVFAGCAGGGFARISAADAGRGDRCRHRCGRKLTHCAPSGRKAPEARGLGGRARHCAGSRRRYRILHPRLGDFRVYSSAHSVRARRFRPLRFSIRTLRSA